MIPASRYEVMICDNELLLATVAIAAHELVYTTCGVDELLLAGEEGV